MKSILTGNKKEGGMSEHKPCPCCGGVPDFLNVNGMRGYIRCAGDDIETRLKATEAEAWALWDRRTPEPEPEKE